MRISDWSSDVCSSDLAGRRDGALDSDRQAADRSRDRYGCRTHRLRLAAGLVMKVDVITLFPELVEQVTRHGMPRLPVEGGQLQLSTRNPRDYSTTKSRRVDARPSGCRTGLGMEAARLPAANRDAKGARAKARGG